MWQWQHLTLSLSWMKHIFKSDLGASQERSSLLCCLHLTQTGVSLACVACNSQSLGEYAAKTAEGAGWRSGQTGRHAGTHTQTLPGRRGETNRGREGGRKERRILPAVFCNSKEGEVQTIILKRTGRLWRSRTFATVVCFLQTWTLTLSAQGVKRRETLNDPTL